MSIFKLVENQSTLIMNRAEIISKIQKFFLDQPVIKAYIFGSFARGDNDEKSDIDIMVELDFRQKIGLNFVRMQLDLQELLSKKVDLVCEGAVSKYILPVIDKEKILIYEK